MDSLGGWAVNLLIAAYANVGPGIFYALVLAIVGISALCWIAYWAPRGFRATTISGRGRRSFLLLVGVATILMAFFPPMRRDGDWRDESTGLAIQNSFARQLDRYWYGFFPSYWWIGDRGSSQRDTTPAAVKFGGHGPFRMTAYRWVIDWQQMCGQFVILALLLLPFLRANSELAA